MNEGKSEDQATHTPTATRPTRDPTAQPRKAPKELDLKIGAIRSAAALDRRHEERELVLRRAADGVLDRDVGRDLVCKGPDKVLNVAAVVCVQTDPSLSVIGTLSWGGRGRGGGEGKVRRPEGEERGKRAARSHSRAPSGTPSLIQFPVDFWHSIGRIKPPSGSLTTAVMS